jgi:hypothetical protein
MLGVLMFAFAHSHRHHHHALPGVTAVLRAS